MSEYISGINMDREGMVFIGFDPEDFTNIQEALSGKEKQIIELPIKSWIQVIADLLSYQTENDIEEILMLAEDKREERKNE